MNGFSVDGIGGVSTVDPRANAKLELGPTTISAGAGMYSQQPQYREMFDTLSGTLVAERATHTSVGISERLTAGVTAGVTGYHHWLHDQVVGREDVFRFDDTSTARPRDLEPFANEGTGRITGVEAQIRVDNEQTIAWLAATFSHSTRIQREGDEVIPDDQPVILTAIASQGLPRKWRIGARARYATGPPMTNIENVIFNIDAADWIPIEGAYRGSRLDAFFATDIRVDKRWQFPRWELATYLEVQNATNRANVEIPTWSQDYTDYWIADPARRGADILLYTCTDLGQGCAEAGGRIDGNEESPPQPLDRWTMLGQLDGTSWSIGFSLPGTALEGVPQSGQALLFALACEPGTCEIFDRVAANPPPGTDAYDAVVDMLADPEPWVAELPRETSTFAVKIVPLQQNQSISNRNPTVTRGPSPFIAEWEVPELIEARFDVFEVPKKFEVRAYTTLGSVVDISPGELSTRVIWNPGTMVGDGEFFLVVSDNNAGIGVWNGRVSVKP